jgi:hypothetical protein
MYQDGVQRYEGATMPFVARGTPASSPSSSMLRRQSTLHMELLTDDSDEEPDAEAEGGSGDDCQG